MEFDKDSKMIDIKGILNSYKRENDTIEAYRLRITPFLEFLSYVSTVKEMSERGLAISKKLPDDYGLKELRETLEKITEELDEYSDDSITESMA